MTPTDTVKAFIAAWNRMDMAAVMTMLSPDIVYHNMPVEPAKGIAAVQAVFASFPPFTGVDWITHNIAASGSIVLTERTDRFQRPDGKWIALPVMGTFEIGDDGKITHWRDYFDMNQFMSQAS